MDVKLSDALATAIPAKHGDIEVTILEGEIGQDPDEAYFRVYPGKDRYRFFIVKKTDIVGNLYKFSDPEMVHLGFVGQMRYRVKIKFGSVYQSVTVKIHTAETGEKPRSRPQHNGQCPSNYHLCDKCPSEDVAACCPNGWDCGCDGGGYAQCS